MGKIYLTREGHKKLQEKLIHLREVKKPEISKRLGIAADHGDLKENFEYHAAKEALTQVMMKIRDITIKLSNAEIIEETDIDSDKVYVGATVHIVDLETGEKEKYIIVSSEEADPMENRISLDSPIARGMLGHMVGDVIEITIPVGTVKYKILEITR